MKKLLFLLPAILLIYSCKKENEAKEYGTYIDVLHGFSFQNDKHEDLLDPGNPDHSIDTANIQVFHEKNGKIVAYTTDYGVIHQKGFMYRQNPDGNRVFIVLNYPEKSGKATTYVQWNNHLRDTIEASFYIPENSSSIYKKKVWVNGKLVWDFNYDELSLYKRVIE